MIVLRTGRAMLALAFAAACSSATEYPCDVDLQCIDAGIAGMCQAPGWCSFPDEACASGQRYGSHAGGGLAGGGVPEDIGTTGGDVAESSFTTASDPTDPSDPGSTSTLSATTPVTTGLDPTDASITSTGDTSSTSTTSSDATTTGASTSEDGSTGAHPMCPTWIDDFEDGLIDAEWELYLADFIDEANGALVFTVTAADDEYPAAGLLESHDLTQGWVRARIGTAPVSYSEHLFLYAGPAASPDNQLLWFIEGGRIYARFDDPMPGWIEIDDVAFDPMLHRWLQIRGDGATAYFEVAGDDLIFETIGSYDPAFALDAMLVGVLAGNYEPLAADVQMSFEQFEVCAP